MMTLLSAGCAESGYDPASFFPEDWQSAFVLVRPCFASEGHASPYVEVYASPDAAEHFVAGKHVATGDGASGVPFPEGSVLMKRQFGDSRCQQHELTSVMKKLSAGSATDRGDWAYQSVWSSGEVTAATGEDGTTDFCAACHAACPNDFVCTPPEAP